MMNAVIWIVTIGETMIPAGCQTPNSAAVSGKVTSWAATDAASADAIGLGRKPERNRVTGFRNRSSPAMAPKESWNAAE
jgi:hypothetical protein